MLPIMQAYCHLPILCLLLVHWTCSYLQRAQRKIHFHSGLFAFITFANCHLPPVSWQPAPPTVLATPLHSSQMVLGGADRMGDNNQNNWATCESTTAKDASGFIQIGCVVVKRRFLLLFVRSCETMVRGQWA